MNLRPWCAMVAVIALVAGLQGPVATTAIAGPAGSSSVAVRAAQSPTTSAKRVSPLTATGHLRARDTVTTSRRGYCWTTSLMNGHLYRCFTGNFILDPCWKESGRNAVICLVLPWSTKVTRLRLTRRLPAVDSYGARIWGLRLGGGIGVDCLVSQGAGGAVGKRPISYFCRRRWVLLGNGPNRGLPLWTMLTARRVGGHYTRRGRKPLRVAWKAVVP
jgi:hypothetical protein